MRLLGRIGDTRAVPTLTEALRSHDNEYVHEDAAVALGDIGDPEATHSLVSAALDDKRTNVRRAAALSLGRITRPARDAVPSLLTAVERAGDSLRRADILRVLGVLRDNRAVPVLLPFLNSQHRDEATAAVSALGRIGDPVALDALGEVLRSGVRDLSLCAALALGQIGDARAVDTLIDTAGHLTATVTVTGGAHAWALRRIGKGAVKPLVKAMRKEATDMSPHIRAMLGRTMHWSSTDWATRREIEILHYLWHADVLAEIRHDVGDDPEFEPLEAAAHDTDEVIQVAARFAVSGKRRVAPLGSADDFPCDAYFYAKSLDPWA